MNGQQYLEVIQKYLPGFQAPDLLEITEDLIQDNDPDRYVLEDISLGRLNANLKEDLMDEYPDMDELLWEKKLPTQFAIPLTTLLALVEYHQVSFNELNISSIGDNRQLDFNPRAKALYIDEIEINF